MANPNFGAMLSEWCARNDEIIAEKAKKWNSEARQAIAKREAEMKIASDEWDAGNV